MPCVRRPCAGMAISIKSRAALREFLAVDVFARHPHQRVWRRRGRVFLLVFIRLRLLLLAIASHLSLCHLVLALLAVNAQPSPESRLKSARTAAISFCLRGSCAVSVTA